MPVHDRSSFENLYAGQPRWEIGRPQQAIIDVADQIIGSVLDAGCGTGENALFFVERGCKVTGIDFLAEPITIAKRKAAERGLTATFLVMDALTIQLKAAGATWDDVVFRRLYVLDMDAFIKIQTDPTMSFPWHPDRPPPSTLIGVTRLSHPDFLIEIDLMAVTGV